MKTSKRLLSFFLAVVMVITTCSVGLTAFAADPKENEVFTYVDDEGKAAKITYEALENLVNTYAPELIEALRGTLEGIGVNVDNIVSSDEPIYTLLAELSPLLIGLIGGSAGPEEVLGSNYKPTDKLYYSYLEDEDAAMSFWSLYQFCVKNGTDDQKSSAVRNFCKNALKDLTPLLNGYANADSAYKAGYQTAESKISSLLGSALNDGNHVLYNVESPELNAAVNTLVEIAGENIIWATADNIGDVVLTNGKTLKEIPAVYDEDGDGVTDVDFTPFIETVQVYARASHAVPADKELTLAEAVYYHYNTLCETSGIIFALATSRGASLELSDMNTGGSFTVEPGKYYAANYGTCFSFETFKSMMEEFGITVGDESFWQGGYEYFVINGIDANYNVDMLASSTQWYYDSVSTILTETNIYENVEAVDAASQSLNFSDADFVAVKERLLDLGRYYNFRDPAYGAMDTRVNVNQFKRGNDSTTDSTKVGSVFEDAHITNDVYKFYIYNLFTLNFNTFKSDLINWNEGDAWTATMTQFAEAADKAFAGYNTSVNLYGQKGNENIINFNYVEAYKDAIIYKNIIAPTITERYEWDNFKPDNEVAINIVNALINGYVNDFLDPETMIGGIISGALSGLLDTQIDIHDILVDIYLKLAEQPVETLFELIPVLVVLLDEVLVPMLFNGPATENDAADRYYAESNDFLWSILFGSSDPLIKGLDQASGSTVGIGQFRWDLNTVLPAVLHWLTGDNSYTYTYYNVEEVTGIDEDGNETVSLIYGTPTTGANGTKYDNNGNQTNLVPVIFNVYALDKFIAYASISDLAKTDNPDEAETMQGLSEIVAELATMFTEVVDEYVAQHGDDVKQYTEDGTPVNKGLNNIFVAVPALINNLGQKFLTKYNVDSDWTFGTFAKDDNGCTYNVTLKNFKDLAANKASAEDIMHTFVDIFINSWLNAITDILNDTVSDTENGITSNIPIVTALLNSLDAFGETSILTDVLNGFFGMTRTDACSFTFEEQENGYVGLDNLNAYFLLINIEPLVKLIMNIVEANKNDDSENPDESGDAGENEGDSETPDDGDNNNNDDTAAVILNMILSADFQKILDDYNKIATQENIKAADNLIETVDNLLAAIFDNAYMNGYHLDQIDSILSSVITFLHNHLGAELTEEVTDLIIDYLYAINAESTKNNGGWNVGSGKNHCEVDAKKVYSKANLSNLVVRTYALVEKIVDKYLIVNGDYANAVVGAVEGILSPSAVAVRSDVIDNDIMECYNWTELSKSKYAKDLGYDNLKAGDKDTFYADLVDSLGAITSIVGTLLCTTGYYNNVLSPIVSSLCDAMGVTGYTKSIAADATGEEAMLAILNTVSSIINRLMDAPASSILGLLKGVFTLLDDSVLKTVINGALNPIVNEINGLATIVDNLSPTFGNKVRGLVDTLSAVLSIIPENDIFVTLINMITGEDTLEPVNWKEVFGNVHNGEVLLLIYTAALDILLSDGMISMIIPSNLKSLAEMLSKLDAVTVLNMLNEIISATQNPTEIYWTFADYAAKETNSFVFPKGITQAKADDAVDSLDELVKNLFPLLQSFDVVKQGNLTEVVSDLLFTNEMITKIATGVYGAIEKAAGATFVFSPAQLADYLMDKSYGNTYSDAANALKKCSSWNDVKNINWGFTDGSSKAEQGFINALAALCRPVNDVLAVFLAEGDANLVEIITMVLKDLDLSIYPDTGDTKLGIRIKDGTLWIYTNNTTRDNAPDNMIKVELLPILDELSQLSIKGGNGYQSAIIPLLEALMCDNIKSYNEYLKDYNNAKDNLLIDILNPVFGFVDDVLEAPFDTLTKVLPNVAYFIDNYGVGQLVDNLLSPVTELIGILNKYIDFNELVDAIVVAATTKEDDEGNVIEGKTLSQMLAEAGMADLKLDFTNLSSCNIHEILIPLVNSLLKNNNINITIPDIDWSKLASLGKSETFTSAAGGSATRIIANQGQVLITVLRFLETAIINNAAEINKLLSGIDAIAKNKTILAILDSVFAQLGTAKHDEIVLAVFYLLAGEPTNKFFDYTGFKYKDYEFTYPGTVDIDFLTTIGPMLDGLVGGLIEGGLNSMISGLIYKDSIITDLAVGLYGAIEGVKINDSMNLAQLLAQTGIDFTTANVAQLLTDKDYGQQYASAAKVIKNANAWSKVNKANLSWGVTDRDSFVHALCAVLRPIYGVLDVLLNDGSLGLFNLIYLPGSDGYTSAIVPLMEAFGLYNIKTQYQYRQDMSKEYDAILLDILNPLLDKVEDLLNAPIEMLADMLPNLALFFANDGLLQLIENLLTPINALLDAIEPVANVNDILKAAGLDIAKELSKLGLVDKSYRFNIYDLSASLKPLIGADNIVGLLNTVLGMIKIGGQPLGIELMPIDWYQLASHGEVITTEASQAATHGGRVYVKADQAEVLIAVLRYLVNTVNYKDNYNVISNLIGGLLGDNVSDSISDVIDQVLGMLAGDTDQVISDLCGLLQTLA